MPTLIIHGFPQSSYVMTARAACEHKGVAYELQPVDRKSAAHLALHPFGKVPALSHGDVRLYETTAITRYVDQVFDGPALIPADPVQAAQVEQWISVVNFYLYGPSVPRYILKYIFAANGPPSAEDLAAGVAGMAPVLDVLDAGLDGRTWLVGEGPTLADLFVGPLLLGISMFPEGKALLAERSNLGPYLGAIMSLDAIRAVLPPPRG